MLTLLFPHPAALVKTNKKRTLVIADPHIGWEHALQEKGIHVPSQTPKILQKLISLLSEHKPDSLLILGDVKFTVLKTDPGEWHDIPDFFSKILDHVDDVSVIRGNHDANLEPLLPEEVKILPASGIRIADTGFFHGHKWPSPILLRCRTLLMGHLHPVMVFRDPTGFKITKPVWIKAQINTNHLSKILLVKKKEIINSPKANQLIVVPSFNDFLGGRAINEKHAGKNDRDKMIGPLLKSNIVNLENAELYLTDGTYLGTLSQMRNISIGSTAAKNLYKANS